MSGPKVVILGAGYGGVVSAQRLQRNLSYNEAEITMVNKHDYHYVKTELHQPAAGTMPTDQARIHIRDLIDEKQVQFVQDSVTEIKTDENKVITENQELEYDYLVVALGGDSETFGIEGLKENAFFIEDINSANEIREHIEYQFAKAKTEPETAEQRLTFIVGGAGFTGIEFVGELADRVPELCQEYEVDRDLVRIINVEAAPTALPGFDPELVEYAMDVLKKKGVEFKIDTPIQQCTEDSITAGDEEIKTSTVVWTGGIRGNAVLDNSGFETMRGRIKVDEYLRAPGFEDVFIIGDCALMINEEQNRPYPPTAQMATQHGLNVAQNITALIRGGSLETFSPDIKGTVASLGRGEAIGVVGDRKLTGTSSSWMKKLIDWRHLYTIGGVPLVLRKGRFK